jgi:WD40 repeat protein
MGRVFRVRHTGWNTDLAMKQPKKELFRNEAQKEAFIHECDAWINLGLHPHIVSCYYVREIGGIPSIFAEWMGGGSLKGYIESGALYEGDDEAALERILDISVQFARGLHYAHEQGLIHQDVKPDNLLLSETGEAKVADFGIADARTVIGAESRHNFSGGSTIVSAAGAYTPAYRSPEQAMGERLTRRTDIWSWAVSVLEMFMGDRLWNDGIVAGIACEDYFGTERIPIPDSIRDLLCRCFKENESERPHNFREIEIVLLQAYRESTGKTYGRAEPKAASDTADSLNNKALSYLDMGKPREAEKCWEQALKVDSGHADSLYNRSVYLWQNARIDDMEAIRLLESGGKNPGYYLARLHLMRGDARTAIGYLHKAAEISGETNDIKNIRLLASQMIEEGRDGKLVRTLPETRNTDLIAFHPDTNRIASLSDSYTAEHKYQIQLWDITTEKKIGSVKTPLEMGLINTFELSPDGIHVLHSSGSNGETINLWNIPEKKCIYTKKIAGSTIYSIHFNLDGKQALLGSSSGMILWDVASGICIRTFETDTVVSSAHFSPDNTRALSGGYTEKTMRIWDIASGECIDSFEHDNLLKVVAFSPDGKQALGISSREMNSIKLWDITTKSCIRTFLCRTDYTVDSVCFSPDGNMVVTSSRDDTKLWDISAGRCIRTYIPANKETGPFKKTSAYFISNGNELVTGGKDGITIWRIPQLRENIEMILSHIHSTGEIMEQTALFDSLVNEIDRLVSDKDITTALIKLEELRNIRTFGSDIAYYAATRKISPYCICGKLREQTLLINTNDLDGSASHFCFSPAGDKALIKQERERTPTLALWDINTRQYLRILDVYTQAICFSPDGRLALWGGVDEIVLWDTATGEYIHTFKAGIAVSVAFSSDGSRIFTMTIIGNNRQVKIWDTVTKECLHTFKVDEHDRKKGDTYSSLFSPDGLKMFIERKGGWRITKESTKLMDVSTGQCIHDFEGIIYCFSPDSSKILTKNWSDHTIKLWDIQTGNYIQTFCPSGNEILSWACFSPDGCKVLTGNSDNGKYAISLWDTYSGECLYSMDTPEYIQPAHITPDGRKFFSSTGDYSSGRKLKLWDIATGECLLSFDLVNIMATFQRPKYKISPDGKKIAFTSGGKFYLYELDYELIFPGWADWEEGARPYLELFLKLHPDWTGGDFSHILIPELQKRGYGWLRPEGVKARLEEMKRERCLG